MSSENDKYYNLPEIMLSDATKLASMLYHFS